MKHKWEKEINHPYCHKFICKKCGCIKDATAMLNTVYWVNGEKYFSAPQCKIELPTHELSDTTNDAM